MSDLKITVAIPVGPYPANRQWLDECVQSARKQSRPADEILLIDDMAGLELPDLDLTIWRSPWLLGVPTAFNCAVALAKHPLVIMLGSDDKLEEWAVEDALTEYEKHHRDDVGYYYFDVQYSDGRQQSVACNGAMVTKDLWNRTGGFPTEAAVGACDTMLVSIMLAHERECGFLYRITSEKPPYWYRVHDGTDTAGRQPWQGVVGQARDILTRDWEPPEWGRKLEVAQ